MGVKVKPAGNRPLQRVRIVPEEFAHRRCAGRKRAEGGMAVTRKPGATWVIPTEDEWYKVAYHKNDGVTGNYGDYPTGSNTPRRWEE